MIAIDANSLRQEWVVNLAELEAAEDAAGLEHSIRLLEHPVDVCAVSDAESDGIQIHAVGLYRV